jgi:hypothetical protein
VRNKRKREWACRESGPNTNRETENPFLNLAATKDRFKMNLNDFKPKFWSFSKIEI